MFEFFKKYERVYIPDDKCEAVVRTLDVLTSAPDNCSALARYKFWVLAYKVCPEIDDGKNNWRFNHNDGSRPCFIKIPAHRKS